MKQIYGLGLWTQPKNQICISVPTFFVLMFCSIFFTQIEKKFRVETKKAVGRITGTRYFFIISPYLVNMSGAFDELLSASEVFLSASDFLSPLLILLLAASD